MSVVRTILLIVFIIVCVLLVLLVLIQSDDDNGMGSAFGGGQSAAFGARSASVLTKTTAVLVALFFLAAFGLGLLNRAPEREDLSGAVQAVEGADTSAEEGGSWVEGELDAGSSTVNTAPAEN